MTGAADERQSAGMPRGHARAVAIYAAVSLLLVAGGAGAMGWFYDSAADRQAIWTSAAVAVAVQVLAFSMARLLAQSGHGIAGWAVGAVVCLATLVIYGFVMRALGASSGAAMVSLAAFFFVTELIEPPLLNL